MPDTPTRVADVGRAIERHARAAALARQIGAAAAAHARAVEIDRGVRATARAMSIDPGGYVVLTPGSPEHAFAADSIKAAEDFARSPIFDALTRARAL